MWCRIQNAWILQNTNYVEVKSLNVQKTPGWDYTKMHLFQIHFLEVFLLFFGSLKSQKEMAQGPGSPRRWSVVMSERWAARSASQSGAILLYVSSDLRYGPLCTLQTWFVLWFHMIIVGYCWHLTSNADPKSRVASPPFGAAEGTEGQVLQH